MFRTILRAALPAALLLTFVLPGTASAFPLTNCTLNLKALDANGATIGTAASGADDATQANPFVVDWNGTVSYDGTTGPLVIKDNSYLVSIYHVPTPIQGGSPNGDGNTKGNGTVGVASNMPFRITGTFFVSGALKGTGGECSGSGWFKLAGDPIGTLPFFAGLGLLIVGLILVVLALGGSAVAGLLGGVLVGLGAAVMLVIYSVVPLGETTPIVVAGIGLVGGVALIFVARMRGKGSPV